MKKIVLLTGDKSYYNNFNAKSPFSDTELLIIDIDNDSIEKIKGLKLDGVIVQCYINKFQINKEGNQEFTPRYEFYSYCLARIK